MKRITNAAMLIIVSMAFLACGEDEGGAEVSLEEEPVRLSRRPISIEYEGELLYEQYALLKPGEGQRIKATTSSMLLASEALDEEDGTYDGVVVMNTIASIRSSSTFGCTSKDLFTLEVNLGGIGPQWAQDIDLNMDTLCGQDSSLGEPFWFEVSQYTEKINGKAVWYGPEGEALTLHLYGIDFPSP